MHGEAPQLKRCCFCLPLRRGLIAWGYVKLVLNLLMVAYVIAVISWFARRSRSVRAVDITIMTVILTLLVTDISFCIVFIVASHKKSVKLLKVSYIYNLVWLGLVLAGYCFQLYVNFSIVYRLWDYVEYRKYIVLDLAYSAGLAFGTIFVQIYLILLIRSEMAKLRAQSMEMQFTNNLVAGEPQCTLHNATVVTEESERMTQVVEE